MKYRTIGIGMYALFATVFILLHLCACTQSKRQLVIGVSQCSEDIWREKQNAELRMAAYFHDNVELRFAAAYDSDERQVQQIDSLMKTGIDLLIVAPNQVATISPAIDRAYDKNIPVIVFERKTNSKKYTAYMGADNYEMGHMMGKYIASQMHGTGRVIEIMGLKGSSPAIERHKGFMDAMSAYPGIQVAATLQGDWTEQSAYKAVSECKEDLQNIDYVFGQNDRMAMGARRAFSESDGAPSATKFCGIDGLPGENGGIRLVRDSILDATFIYPTHGDRLLQMAVDILEGRPCEKEVFLMSALVTRENANVLLMQNDEIVRQSDYLDRLHNKADDYLHQLDTQRIINLMVIILVVLLLAVAVILYRYHLQKLHIQEERGKMEREQLDFYTQAAHELRTPLTLIEGPLDQLANTPMIQNSKGEAAEIFAIVKRNTSQLTALVNKILNVQEKGEIPDDHQAAQESSSEQTLQPSSPPSPTFSETKTLLIVDDNADIRTYLRTILKDKYQLFEAEDGQKGLEIAKEQVPDLIISDVMMPVINGLEFCQKIKDDMVTSHIPVILLTARALNQHQIEGYESGADAYITKPFQPDLLLARISNLLRSRHQLRNLWNNESKGEAPENDTKNAEEQIEVKENAFIVRFKNVLEERMGDSDLSVEDIASEMHLSRVQLYRKVKALTGNSPVDLMRRARLARAQKLLSETELSVSEIAYQVGFTSPSYFTKCFKDEFGKVPGESR